MKAFWNAFALKIVWDSFFMNDAHFIVSRHGLEILEKMRRKEALIELMKHDEEAGMYEYVTQTENKIIEGKIVSPEEVKSKRIFYENYIYSNKNNESKK